VTTVRSRPPVHALVSIPNASAEMVELTRIELVGQADRVQVDEAAPAPRGKHARLDKTQDETDTTYDEHASPEPAAPAAGGEPARLGLPEQVAGRRGHRAPTEPTLEVEAMLALLAAESSKPLGGLVGRLDTNAGRFGLIAGGIVAFSALLFLVLAVIGSML
jgi:hypothetical protein